MHTVEITLEQVLLARDRRGGRPPAPAPPVRGAPGGVNQEKYPARHGHPRGRRGPPPPVRCGTGIRE